MKRLLPVLNIFLLFQIVIIPSLYSENARVLPKAADFTRMLGWELDTAVSEKGIPESMFPFRGANSKEDNVVFYYPDNIYLFWFHDRVWQVRADKRWKGSVDGVSMGMKKTGVISLWGKPVNDFDASPTWVITTRGFPVRIRLYFDKDGTLSDLYVYRSDW